MVFTQSSSVSNNLKIPTYYLIFADLTKTKKKTKTECSKDPTCAMFLKSRGFKDIKYDTHRSHPDQILADLILELAF